MPPGLNGTTSERIVESVNFAEEARRQVVIKGEPVKDKVRREFARRDAANRTVTDPDVVEADAGYRADNSPQVQFEIQREQWGTRLATMYAVVRQVDQSARTNKLLERIVQQNDLMISFMAQLLNEVRGVPPADVVEAGLHPGS